MNYLIESCIFPIIDGQDCVGQGFVADDFFITAAHVVKNYPNCFVEINGSRVKLCDVTPIYIGKGDIDKDSKAEDVAIYAFDNIHSFLHLSARTLSKSDYIRSVCIAVNHESANNQYYRDLYILEATLLDQTEGNYFYCKCARYEGSSGSPLIVGNEVVGIMHGGDSNGLCAFLKPISFMYPEGSYNSFLIRGLSNLPKPEEPWTPEYFNRKAQEQLGDAFE